MYPLISFYKKLPNMKPIEKHWKEIEGILFHVFNTMVRKKTQGVSSNLFAIGRKISDSVANSPTFLRINALYVLDVIIVFEID